MLPTRIAIPAKTRATLCNLLNERLADAIDLQGQCKQAHWTLRGPNFYSLHLLFDKVNEDVEDYVDLIAERVAQLGGQAQGTVQAVAKRTSLNPYPLDLIDASAHVEALANALGTFANLIRKAIDQADDLKDQGTSDMFTEISRGVDSWLWMVESHLIDSSDATAPPSTKK
jgi:starvation-inducible DNA-binding protein